MAFTVEQRAKAIASIKANAAQRRLDKATAASRGKGSDLSESSLVHARRVPGEGLSLPAKMYPGAIMSTEFDWRESPINICLEKQADMKREYDRISQIILQRTSQLPQVYICWSKKQPRGTVPESVLAQCRGQIKDGSWVSRDDGHKNAEGRIEPAVCCSNLCYQVYSQNRPIGGMSRH